MPVSAARGNVPLGLTGPEGVEAELQWKRWVAGRKSTWQGRGVAVVGADKLVMSGCTSDQLDALPDQTFVYNLVNNSWQSYEAEGTGPISAPQHVTVSVGNTLFVFWYLSPRRHWPPLSDPSSGRFVCSILQTVPTMQWSLGDFVGTPPNLTTGFSAITDSSNNIVLYGGQDDLSQVTNALYLLDLADGKYTRIATTCTSRTHHAAALIPRNTIKGGNNESMLVWGGMSADGRLHNDMQLLDLSTWTWTEVKQQGLMPTPRMGHNIVNVGAHLVLYGGESSIDDTTASVTSVFSFAHCRWITDVDETGVIPPVRSGAYAAQCLDGKDILLFGGKQPLTDEPYFDLFGMHCNVRGNWAPNASSPDDEDFLSMSPQVQLLSLEQERKRLQQDNHRLRNMEDAAQRNGISMAIEEERTRWEQEQQAAGQAMAGDLNKAQKEREEAIAVHKELLEKHGKIEQSYNELKQQRNEDHTTALEDIKDKEHAMQQRLDDEWNRRMEEHEEEYRREREALAEQAEKLSNEQQRLKLLWEEQKKEAEKQHNVFEEQRKELEDWENEQNEKLQEEREALQSLRQELEKRERDVQEMIRQSKEEIAQERRELAKARKELEQVEKVRNDLIVEQAEIAEEKRELEMMREEKKSDDGELEMSAVQSSIIQDGGIPLGCSRFLMSVYDNTKKWCGKVFMTLSALFRLLKTGQLMRGHITIDLVLDVVHAAQSSVHPSNPAMPSEIDCDVFITVVIDIIHRLYGSTTTVNDTVDMTVVEHIIEGGLRKTWDDNALQKVLSRADVILDEACSLPVAEVLHEHRDVLIQLFKRHANSNSAVVSPYEFMTLMQLVSCLEAMRVIPHLASVDDVCNDVIHTVTGAVDELSPHELTEVIARLALLGFTDDAPSCDKVHRLMSSEELREAASLEKEKAPPPVTLARRQPKRRDSTGNKVRSSSAHAHKVSLTPNEVGALLQNKAQLKEEMQRIYLYYSSLNGSSDGVNALKWSRLCQDTECLATHRHYAHSTPSNTFKPSNGLLPKTVIDSVFVDTLAECGLGKNSCLDFDGLMVAFRRLACKMHPHLEDSPNDALHALLLEHILRHGLRCAETLLQVGLDAHTEDMLQRSKGASILYNTYCSAGVGRGDLTAQSFLKLMADFKIVPSLLSNTECGQVYRAAKLRRDASTGTALMYSCLVIAAHVAFSKHPYNTKLPDIEVRLQELMERLMLHDVHSMKHTLEKLGLKVKGTRSSTPPLKTSGHGMKGTPPKRQVGAVPLDDEQCLDRALKTIFSAYSHFGRMEIHNFVKLCIDTKVAHRTDFPRSQIESTFYDSCTAEHYLTFDEWCDALLMLGHRRFPNIHQSDALRALLTTCILPLADRR